MSVAIELADAHPFQLSTDLISLHVYRHDTTIIFTQVIHHIKYLVLQRHRFSCVFSSLDLSHLMTKPTKRPVRPRNLRSAWASAQSDQSLRCPHEETLSYPLCAEWVAKDPSFLHAHSEDSDPAGRMSRLIWDFAGRTSFFFFFFGFVMSRFIFSS